MDFIMYVSVIFIFEFSLFIFRILITYLNIGYSM